MTQSTLPPSNSPKTRTFLGLTLESGKPLRLVISRHVLDRFHPDNCSRVAVALDAAGPSATISELTHARIARFDGED